MMLRPVEWVALLRQEQRNHNARLCLYLKMFVVCGNEYGFLLKFARYIALLMREYIHTIVSCQRVNYWQLLPKLFRNRIGTSNKPVRPHERARNQLQ